jgi:AcrR family transcriptional regulator
MAAEETAARIQAKFEEKAARHGEEAKKASRQRNPRKAEQHARKQAHLEALAQQIPYEIWTRIESAGRRPRFSRDQLAEAALHIADSEGFDALSMRRLAIELGAGTMTLYHYVRTKDELLALLHDRVMAEVALPEGDSLPGNWRDAMAVIARRSRDAFLRHPWVMDIPDDAPVGPNGVRHFDQTMEALSSLDLELEEKLDIAVLVDDYVLGHCLRHRNPPAPARPEVGEQLYTYLHDLISNGRYPGIAGFVERLGFRPTWNRLQSSITDEGRFDRNLEHVFDGIDVGLARRAR